MQDFVRDDVQDSCKALLCLKGVMQRLVEECSKKDTPWRSTLESLLDPALVDCRPGQQDEPEDYGELLMGRSDEQQHPSARNSQSKPQAIDLQEPS